jgi:hypothetical protein
VSLDDEALALQTEFSMRCYSAYHRAQELREAIDLELGIGAGDRHEPLAALRGLDSPGDPDILYGSIEAVVPAEETVVGLQHKLLFMLNLLQGADARPTSQAQAAVHELEASLAALARRWQALSG